MLDTPTLITPKEKISNYADDLTIYSQVSYVLTHEIFGLTFPNLNWFPKNWMATSSKSLSTTYFHQWNEKTASPLQRYFTKANTHSIKPQKCLWSHDTHWTLTFHTNNTTSKAIRKINAIKTFTDTKFSKLKLSIIFRRQHTFLSQLPLPSIGRNKIPI